MTFAGAPSTIKRTLAALASKGSSPAACCGQRSEPLVATALYGIKLIRFFALWIALYTVDKVWRDMYVQSVVERAPRPPSMRWMMAAALAIELILLGVLLVSLALLSAALGTNGSRFILDSCFLRLVLVDYLLTSALLLVLGVAFASVAQDARLFRFGDDGLRGVRATTTLLWMTSASVLALPLYRVV